MFKCFVQFPILSESLAIVHLCLCVCPDPRRLALTPVLLLACSFDASSARFVPPCALLYVSCPFSISHAPCKADPLIMSAHSWLLLSTGAWMRLPVANVCFTVSCRVCVHVHVGVCRGVKKNLHLPSFPCQGFTPFTPKTPPKILQMLAGKPHLPLFWGKWGFRGFLPRLPPFTLFNDSPSVRLTTQ